MLEIGISASKCSSRCSSTQLEVPQQKAHERNESSKRTVRNHPCIPIEVPSEIYPSSFLSLHQERTFELAQHLASTDEREHRMGLRGTFCRIRRQKNTSMQVCSGTNQSK